MTAICFSAIIFVGFMRTSTVISSLRKQYRNVVLVVIKRCMLLDDLFKVISGRCQRKAFQLVKVSPDLTQSI
jgi:hypothetical protein